LPQGFVHPANAVVTTSLHGASPKPCEFEFGAVDTGETPLAGMLVQLSSGLVILGESGDNIIGFLDVIPDKPRDGDDAPFELGDQVKVVMGECVTLLWVNGAIDEGNFLEPDDDGLAVLQTTGMCCGQALETSATTTPKKILVHFFKCPPPAVSV